MDGTNTPNHLYTYVILPMCRFDVWLFRCSAVLCCTFSSLCSFRATLFRPLPFCRLLFRPFALLTPCYPIVLPKNTKLAFPLKDVNSLSNEKTERFHGA